MGGRQSKRTKAQQCSRQESALNSRAYKITNPPTSVPTPNIINYASQTQATVQTRQPHDDSARTKENDTQTNHRFININPEACNIPTQKKYSIPAFIVKDDLHNPTKMYRAIFVKETANSDVKPDSNVAASIDNASPSKHCIQLPTQKIVVENTCNTKTKMNKCTRSNSKVIKVKTTPLEICTLPTLDVSHKVIKTENCDIINSMTFSRRHNASTAMNKAVSHAMPKNKNEKRNNRGAVKWGTNKNWQNELYIGRKDMKEFFELLKCPVCYQRIKGQIQKCVVGHFICAPCRSNLDRDICPICQSEMSKERMVTLENMIEVISMQCPYRKFGCRHTVNPIQMQQHMEECSFRVISCVDAKCSWEGKLEHIAFHYAKQHSEKVLAKPRELIVPSTKQDYTHTYLLRLNYRHNFFCRFKVCNMANILSIAMQSVPMSKFKLEEWSYRMTLVAGIKRTIYTDLKVHEFKNTDSLNQAAKNLIIPLSEAELFEVDGSIKCKIWFTKIDAEMVTPAVDGYSGVRDSMAELKMKSEKCGA